MNDIVFIHGGRQGSWVWNETIASLKKTNNNRIGKVITLDVPGCGKKSGTPKPHFHVDDIVKELAQEILEAGVHNGMIVSHSQGGTLVPGIISKTATCFSKAFFIATAAPLERQTITEMMGNGMHGENDARVGWPLPPESTEPQVLFSAMFRDKYMSEEMLQFILGRAQVDDWPSASATSDNHWNWKHLQSIESLYLIAKKDNILPLVWQEKFAKRLSENTHKFYVDAGHQVIQTQPDIVASIINSIVCDTYKS